MRILLVEDDRKFCYTLAFQLEENHFHVDTCSNGEEALFEMEQGNYDLILLDRMLPALEGLSVLKTFRSRGHSTPVILITALGELSDKVTGLDTGADDYLVKPFEFEELLARIRCIRRRPRKWEPGSCIKFLDLSLYPEENRLLGPGGGCSLSNRENTLLTILMQNHGQILPRNVLLIKVWGTDSDIEDGNLDNYIYFLRRKLKGVNSSVMLKTIRGLGYCLSNPNT